MNSNSTDKAVIAFEKLKNNVPDIGFFSRKKRVYAYRAVTNDAQQMIDCEEISDTEALFVLSLLMRKNKNFQKAGMMTALNLAAVDKNFLKPIGLRYAKEIRKSLKLPDLENAVSEPEQKNE